MPIQMPQGPPNQVHSLPGAPDGVNQSLPPSEIKDTEAQTIQDAFVNEPSYMIRRGPVRGAIGTPALAYKGCGLATALAPDDQVYLAGFSGDASHGKMEVLDTSLSTVQATNDWDTFLPVDPSYLIFHAQPALNRGTLIDISDTYGLRTGGKYAAGSLDFATEVTNVLIGKTVTIGSQTYTFAGSASDPDQINAPGAAGATDPGWKMAQRLANAINAGPGAGSDYGTGTVQNPDVAATASGTTIRLQAREVGTGGNTLETSSTVPGAAKAVRLADDDYATTADDADLSPTSRITIEAWVKPSTLNAADHHYIVFKDQAYYLALVKSGSNYRARMAIWKGGGWVTVTGSTNLAVDTTYYIVGLYTGSNLRVYIGATQDGSISTSGSINNSTADLYIGYTTGQGLIGDLDDVAIYSTNLSTTRITAHKNAGTGGGGSYAEAVTTDTPKAFWKFDGSATPSHDYVGSHDLDWPVGHGPTFQVDPLVQEEDAGQLVVNQATLSGGVDGGTSSQTLGYWMGGASADRSDTITVSRGSTTVTGTGTSWLTTLTPGMWVMYNNSLVGCVNEISDDDTLELLNPALVAVSGASADFVAVRGLYPSIRTGDITCATDDPTVTGGNTKFQDEGLGSGTWDIFRARDYAFVGTVASVTNNISLELSANANIAMSEEFYVAIKRGSATLYTLTTTDPNHLGFLTTVWAGHQWYANRSTTIEETYRLWFSDPDDPESVDTSSTGDWLTIPSAGNVNTPILGMAPCYNGLAIFKADESFLLSGTNPDDFQLRKMINDGLMSTTGVAIYKSGVIWPGRDGIYYYKGIGTQYLEGIDIANLTQNSIGFNWRKATQDFDPNSQRMWGLVAHDHYFLFTEVYNSPVPIVKGSTTTTPTNWTIVINLQTGALVFLSNVTIRGGVNLNDIEGAPTYYLVNTDTEGHICSSLDLFYATGVDEFDTDVAGAGPDFYFESKKFPMEDPLILKRVKQLTFHHLNDGDDLMVDVIPGLNEVGTTLTGVLPDTSGIWDVSRLRFSKKTQYFSFRVYQGSSDMSKISLGPFQLKYKPLRPGRV